MTFQNNHTWPNDPISEWIRILGPDAAKIEIAELVDVTQVYDGVQYVRCHNYRIVPIPIITLIGGNIAMITLPRHLGDRLKECIRNGTLFIGVRLHDVPFFATIQPILQHFGF